MLVEALLLIAVAITGVMSITGRVLYPRHRRIFRGKPKWVSLMQSVFPILLIVLLIRSFTFETFHIPSGSMQPTLLPGDLVVVDKYSLGLRVPILGARLTGGQPQRGDIVVFRGEVEGKNANVIKRIVGLPGDHIKYQNRTLYVNNVPAIQLNINSDLDQDGKVIRATEDLGGVQHEIFMALKNEQIDYPFKDLVVPDHSYFVLGDHRSNSHDSRYIGVVSDKKLVGKARRVAFSLDWAQKKVRWSRSGSKL